MYMQVHVRRIKCIICAVRFLKQISRTCTWLYWVSSVFDMLGRIMRSILEYFDQTNTLNNSPSRCRYLQTSSWRAGWVRTQGHSLLDSHLRTHAQRAACEEQRKREPASKRHRSVARGRPQGAFSRHETFFGKFIVSRNIVTLSFVALRETHVLWWRLQDSVHRKQKAVQLSAAARLEDVVRVARPHCATRRRELRVRHLLEHLL